MFGFRFFIILALFYSASIYTGEDDELYKILIGAEKENIPKQDQIYFNFKKIDTDGAINIQTLQESSAQDSNNLEEILRQEGQGHLLIGMKFHNENLTLEQKRSRIGLGPYEADGQKGVDKEMQALGALVRFPYGYNPDPRQPIEQFMIEMFNDMKKAGKDSPNKDEILKKLEAFLEKNKEKYQIDFNGLGKTRKDIMATSAANLLKMYNRVNVKDNKGQIDESKIVEFGRELGSLMRNPMILPAKDAAEFVNEQAQTISQYNQLPLEKRNSSEVFNTALKQIKVQDRESIENFSEYFDLLDREKRSLAFDTAMKSAEAKKHAVIEQLLERKKTAAEKFLEAKEAPVDDAKYDQTLSFLLTESAPPLDQKKLAAKAQARIANPNLAPKTRESLIGQMLTHPNEEVRSSMVNALLKSQIPQDVKVKMATQYLQSLSNEMIKKDLKGLCGKSCDSSEREKVAEKDLGTLNAFNFLSKVASEGKTHNDQLAQTLTKYVDRVGNVSQGSLISGYRQCSGQLVPDSDGPSRICFCPSMSTAYENMVNTLGKSFNPELLPNRHLIMKSAKNLCETFKKAGFPLPAAEIQDRTCAQNQAMINSNDQTNTGSAFCRVYDPRNNPLKVPEEAFKNDENNNYLNRGYACRKGNDHGLDFNLNLDSFKSPENLMCQGVARNNAAPLLALATNLNPILERMEGAAVNNKVAQGLYLKALRKKQVDAIKSALAKNIDFITGNNDLLAKAKASLEKLDKCGLGDESLKDALKKKENPDEIAKNRAARDKAYEDMISDKPGPGGLSARDQIQKYVALKRKVSSEKENKFGQRNNYNKWFQGLPSADQTRYQSTHQSLQYLYSQRTNLRNSQDFYKMQQNEAYVKKVQMQTEDIEKAIRTQETYATSLSNYNDYKVYHGMEEEEEYVKNFERGPYAFMIDPEDMKNRVGGFMNMFANHLREGNPQESKKACPNDGKVRMNYSDCTIPGKKDLLRDDGKHHVFEGTANYSVGDQYVKTIGDQYDRAFKFGLYQLDNMYGCDAMPDEMLNGDYNPDESIASDEVWSKSMPFLTSLTGGRKYEFLPTELMEKAEKEGWSTKGYNGLAKNSPEQKMYQVQGVLTLMKNQHLRQSVMNDFPELSKIDCNFSNEVDDKFHKLQHFPTIQKAGMIFDGLAITGAAIGTSLIPGVGPLATAGVIGYAGYVYVINAQEEASAAEHRYKLKASSFYNGSLTDVTGEQVGEAMQEAIDADAGVYEQMAWLGVDAVTLGAGSKVSAARRTMVLNKSKTLFKESVEKASQGAKNAAEKAKIYREHRALLETGHFAKLAAKEVPLAQFVGSELATTAKQMGKDLFTGSEWIKSGQAAAQMAKAMAYPILHPIKTIIAAKRLFLEQTVNVQEVLLKSSKIKGAPQNLLSMSDGQFQKWVTSNPSKLEVNVAEKQRVLFRSILKYGQAIPASTRMEKMKILAKTLEGKDGQKLISMITKDAETGERFFSAFSHRAISNSKENFAHEIEDLVSQFVNPKLEARPDRIQRRIVAEAPSVALSPGREQLEARAKKFLENERKRNPGAVTPVNDKSKPLEKVIDYDQELAAMDAIVGIPVTPRLAPLSEAERLAKLETGFNKKGFLNDRMVKKAPTESEMKVEISPDGERALRQIAEIKKTNTTINTNETKRNTAAIYDDELTAKEAIVPKRVVNSPPEISPEIIEIVDIPVTPRLAPLTETERLAKLEKGFNQKGFVNDRMVEKVPAQTEMEVKISIDGEKKLKQKVAEQKLETTPIDADQIDIGPLAPSAVLPKIIPRNPLVTLNSSLGEIKPGSKITLINGKGTESIHIEFKVKERGVDAEKGIYFKVDPDAEVVYRGSNGKILKKEKMAGDGKIYVENSDLLLTSNRIIDLTDDQSKFAASFLSKPDLEKFRNMSFHDQRKIIAKLDEKLARKEALTNEEFDLLAQYYLAKRGRAIAKDKLAELRSAFKENNPDVAAKKIRQIFQGTKDKDILKGLDSIELRLRSNVVEVSDVNRINLKFWEAKSLTPTEQLALKEHRYYPRSTSNLTVDELVTKYDGPRFRQAYNKKFFQESIAWKALEDRADGAQLRGVMKLWENPRDVFKYLKKIDQEVLEESKKLWTKKYPDKVFNMDDALKDQLLMEDSLKSVMLKSEKIDGFKGVKVIAKSEGELTDEEFRALHEGKILTEDLPFKDETHGAHVHRLQVYLISKDMKVNPERYGLMRNTKGELVNSSGKVIKTSDVYQGISSHSRNPNEYREVNRFLVDEVNIDWINNPDYLTKLTRQEFQSLGRAMNGEPLVFIAETKKTASGIIVSKNKNSNEFIFNGKAVGQIDYTITGDVLEIKMVKVDSEMRGRGVNQQLLEDLFKKNPQINTIHYDLQLENQAAFLKGLPEGGASGLFNLSQIEREAAILAAIRETPAYKTSAKLGLENIDDVFYIGGRDYIEFNVYRGPANKAAKSIKLNQLPEPPAKVQETNLIAKESETKKITKMSKEVVDKSLSSQSVKSADAILEGRVLTKAEQADIDNNKFYLPSQKSLTADELVAKYDGPLFHTKEAQIDFNTSIVNRSDADALNGIRKYFSQPKDFFNDVKDFENKILKKAEEIWVETRPDEKFTLEALYQDRKVFGSNSVLNESYDTVLADLEQKAGFKKSVVVKNFAKDEVIQRLYSSGTPFRDLELAYDKHGRDAHRLQWIFIQSDMERNPERYGLHLQGGTIVNSQGVKTAAADLYKGLANNSKDTAEFAKIHIRLVDSKDAEWFNRPEFLTPLLKREFKVLSEALATTVK